MSVTVQIRTKLKHLDTVMRQTVQILKKLKLDAAVKYFVEISPYKPERVRFTIK